MIARKNISGIIRRLPWRRISSLLLCLLIFLTPVLNTGILNAFQEKLLIDKVTIKTRLYNTFISEVSFEKVLGSTKRYYHIKAMEDGRYGLYINIESSAKLIIKDARELEFFADSYIGFTEDDVEIFRNLFKKIIIFNPTVTLKRRIAVRKYLKTIFTKYIYRPGRIKFAFRKDRITSAYLNNVKLTGKISSIIKANSNSESQKLIENYLLAMPYLPVLKRCVRDNVVKEDITEINERMFFAIWLTYLESNFNPHLSGLANEGGIIQIIPALAKYLGIEMPDYDTCLLYPGMMLKVRAPGRQGYVEGLVTEDGIQTHRAPLITHGEVSFRDDEYFVNPESDKKLEIHDSIIIANHSVGEVRKYSVADLVAGKEKILVRIGPGKYIEEQVTRGFVHKDRLYTWFLPCPEPGVDERLDPLVMLKIYKYIFAYMNTLEKYNFSPIKKAALSIVYFNSGPGFSNRIWKKYGDRLLSINNDASFLALLKSRIPDVTVSYIDSFTYLYGKSKNHETDLATLAANAMNMWKRNYFDLEHFYQGRNGHELRYIARGEFEELEEYNRERKLELENQEPSKKSKKKTGQGKEDSRKEFPLWFRYNFELEELLGTIREES